MLQLPLMATLLRLGSSQVLCLWKALQKPLAPPPQGAETLVPMPVVGASDPSLQRMPVVDAFL